MGSRAEREAAKAGRWLGDQPVRCELCKEKLADVFYDARIPGVGAWALICPLCAEALDIRLGTGSAQKFSLHAQLTEA